ncbi:MAG: hypothetical protein KatS3mg112_1786 [Thermogutta sp.]|nr:MAG: hypothetical protein KatS3mg112_1786 [Thermogutta sp.]
MVHRLFVRFGYCGRERDGFSVFLSAGPYSGGRGRSSGPGRRVPLLRDGDAHPPTEVSTGNRPRDPVGPGKRTTGTSPTIGRCVPVRFRAPRSGGFAACRCYRICAACRECCGGRRIRARLALRATRGNLSGKPGEQVLRFRRPSRRFIISHALRDMSWKPPARCWAPTPCARFARLSFI